MSSSFEIRREGEIDYSKPLARALLRDCRLSFGARGLFAFLWDLPRGWRTNSTHLALMSPQGRDAVRTLLKELETVGAMRDEPIQNAAGRLEGRRWVLVAPERWAIEASLSTNKTLEVAPEAESTERRVFRSSENPTVGKPDTKVYQGEGRSNKTTTTAPQVPTTGSGGGFDSLIIEPVISPFLPQLLDILQKSGIADPALAQDLLDELAGTIEAGLRGERAKVGNPSSWLKALSGGDLKRARCFEVQARRLSAGENERQRKFAAASAATDPDASAKGAEIFAAARRRRQSQPQHS